MFSRWFTIIFLIFMIESALGSKNWICDLTNRCIKCTAQTNDKGFVRYESQNDCRLSCSKYGAIWPQPTGKCNLSHHRIKFNPEMIKFTVHTPTGETTKFVNETAQIFINNIQKEILTETSFTGTCQTISVNITAKSPSLTLDWETNESYSLRIITTAQTTIVDINAETVFGCRHGLETLSNLITGSQEGGLMLVDSADITDEPRFPHRGLLIDTSRNYIPVRYIKRALDGMAASKLNVFHWHVTDTHSFPLEVSRVPELQRYGAYSAKQVYSRADTRNIIKYGKIRGIRVLIEIDGPSHAGNGWEWGPSKGLGKLAVCINSNPWPLFCVQPPCGQLNPVNDEMYRILKDVYTDIAEMIEPEETLHMGGDEVHIPCWNNTKEIVRKMKEYGLDTSEESFLKLWSYFHLTNQISWNEVNERRTLSKPAILWSSRLTDPEIIENYLPNDKFIIQTWVESDSNINEQLLAKGYRIIVSTVDAWYLDHGFWGGTKYHNWRQVYNNRLIVNNPLFLGGEVCMWSEYVDEHALEGRVWPRSGAAAERLWSNPKKFSNMVEPRFYRYRERLIARGLEPEAVTPHWCVLNEGKCY